ncbi:hypothetical protein Sjap_018317 [Stephania japonica]|uniref:TLC domain-containing protein n=1 Tax=Stephania japonica TaxID=461633 RepID=A0AAP0NJ85_9MAGN
MHLFDDVRPREKDMARGEGQSRGNNDNNSGVFFLATLLLWFVSVAFEIAFNARTELLSIVAGCCFYQMVNWVVRYFVTKDPLFVNTAVSLVHSSIASFSVFFILVNQWNMTSLEQMFEHSQLFSGTWSGAYQALCFSCGYFAYDQLDMLLYQLYSGYIPAILVHHLILLVCFTLALYRNVTINYLVLTLICEFHSIFLHVRKVRRMVGVRDPKSKIVCAEWTLSWIFFLTARLGSHILITIKLIKDANKFGRGVELPLALFGMVGMNLLNVFLGRDLFIAYKREIHQHNRQD